MTGPFTITLNQCARCGERHEDLIVVEITPPYIGRDGLTYPELATCPRTAKEIHIRTVSTDEVES